MKKADNEKKEIQKGINLEWCMNFNYDIMNSVINLSTREEKKFFFVSGHFGVIYNYQN